MQTASTQNLNLDDLTSPCSPTSSAVEYTEAREVVLDIDRMLDEAVAQAGADDLADDDGFADRLAAPGAAWLTRQIERFT